MVRTAHISIIYALLTLSALAAIWGGTFLILSQQRRDLLSRATHDTANIARAFEENTAHVLDAADEALLFLRSTYALDRKGFTFAAWNAAARNSDGTILQVAIIGKDGMLLMTNLSQVTKPMNLSDREHFIRQRDGEGDRLFISKPVKGRESGRTSIQLTRKLMDADGLFDGIIVASLDPAMLARFYGSVDVGHGFVALTGTDGIQRAGTPSSRITVGADVSASPGFAVAKGRDSGTSEFVDRLGQNDIMSFRLLPRYGLIIEVAMARDEVLAPFIRAANEYVAAAVILSAMGLLVSLVLVRHKRHLLRTRFELIVSRGALSDTLENMTQGIMMVCADGRIPVMNRRAAELLCLPAHISMDNLVFDDLVQSQAKTDGSCPPGLEPLANALRVCEGVRSDGTVMEVRTAVMEDGRAIRTLTDITERRQAEDRIRYLALYDNITGLANRTLFAERVEAAVAASKADRTTFSILFLSIDRFKAANDAWDNASLDCLARLVAERLSQNAYGAGAIARFGGDEFAILQSEDQSCEAAANLAERLIHAISAPFDVLGRSVNVTATVGAAVYPAHGADTTSVLKSCDAALYSAKRMPASGVYCLFDAELDHGIQERAALERDLREAITDGHIDVHYQPICDITSGRPIGYEALARWRHPRLGMVPPNKFIPIAEESGLIKALGNAVLRTACRAATSWPEAMLVTVNFSALQLREPGFETSVMDVLTDTGLAPSRLGLEVTEGMLISEDDTGATEGLKALHDQGVRIYLDDFGTGHAGLTYLLRIGFDCIKLDRSFVSRMLHDKIARAVVELTLAMAKSLKMDLVAEGVETTEEMEMLHSLGCRRIQGYLYGKPTAIPLHEMADAA